MNDVIIIGGSFAGLAGDLQLGRARRKITVLDTGLPRTARRQVSSPSSRCWFRTRTVSALKN